MKRILESPAITFFLALAIIVLLTLWIIYYRQIGNQVLFDPYSIVEGVFIEFHGLVFDLIFFGVILSLYNARMNKRNNIQRWQEELDDYRGWDEAEAKHRVGGLLRRLDGEGVEDIDLNNLHLGQAKTETIIRAIREPKTRIVSLQETNLKGADLQGAILGGADLQGANLGGANLQGAMLWRANLKRAKLGGADLQKATLAFANLQRADLGGADLQGANLRGVDLQGAYVWNANLQGAKVDSLDWFEKLHEWEVTGALGLSKMYYIDPKRHGDEYGGTYYAIKERPVKEEEE